MVKRKLVTVKDSGAIPELNFVTGPIARPTEIALSSIIKMVSNGRKVFECNPANHSDMVELSLANVKKENFVNTNPVSSIPEEKKEEAPSTSPVVEVKDETPVEEKKEEVPEETPVEKEDTKQPQKNNKNKQIVSINVIENKINIMI